MKLNRTLIAVANVSIIPISKLLNGNTSNQITSGSDEILIVKTFLLVVSSFNALSIVESFFRMNHVYLHVYVCLYANSLLLISNVFMM